MTMDNNVRQIEIAAGRRIGVKSELFDPDHATALPGAPDPEAKDERALVMESLRTQTAAMTEIIAGFRESREQSIAERIAAGVEPERAARAQAEGLAAQRAQEATIARSEAERTRKETAAAVTASEKKLNEAMAQVETLRRAPPIFAPQAPAPGEISVDPVRGVNGRITQFVLKAPGQEEVRINVQRDVSGRLLNLVHQGRS